MKTALEHPLVGDYLRTLDGALASLEPGAAAELSKQIKAHIVEALPAGASDDRVAAVLAALGPPATIAAEAGPPWPRRTRPWQSGTRLFSGTRAGRFTLANSEVYDNGVLYLHYDPAG